MKTLGLIGGTTWVSTIEYYRLINKMVNERLGGVNSAKILLYSLNFEDFRPPSDPAKWVGVTENLSGIALKLQNGGADCIVMCANTPHLVADDVQKNINIPLINIAEVTAEEIRSQNLTKIGLLGTKFTMEQDFFKIKLKQYGIDTLIPDDIDREFVHTSIFNELNRDIFTKSTKEKYLEIIDRLKNKGAEGVILGCTEIPLLIKPTDCDIPIFDTTLIHSKAAVKFALKD